MFRTAVLSRPKALARPAGYVPALGRMYSDGRSEGKVATSQGFGKREKAQEDIFIREQEKAQLAKLRAALQKQRDDLAALEAEHDALATKVAEEGDKK
ncbi:hypothetical protein DACRYDRAFT_23173 [Dacryopinax primogenitus]|uniref:ATPase inhibitor, mitochondrial n=1 Tax=Dacryopinax primogenitus (strain DJM 731) TaxID=1858805 RepID=M5FV80_DACPD|nr:uncharacterized protein DACRYDRAFT_23173 [Dacryopinax primogenitus]EJU00179.1 hypothetical protein DACRYDRAFT_23173 [Dacryopinax primogenitus]